MFSFLGIFLLVKVKTRGDDDEKDDVNGVLILFMIQLHPGQRCQPFREGIHYL